MEDANRKHWVAYLCSAVLVAMGETALRTMDTRQISPNRTKYSHVPGGSLCGVGRPFGVFVREYTKTEFECEIDTYCALGLHPSAQPFETVES